MIEIGVERENKGNGRKDMLLCWSSNMVQGVSVFPY